MKTNELRELHAKSKDELQKLLSDAQEAFFSLRMDHTQLKLKNVRSLSVKRREIAQIQSVLRGKELANG